MAQRDTLAPKVEQFPTQPKEFIMLYQSINPATGQVVKTFDAITDADLERAVSKAHNTFETDWPRRTVADRARVVAKAAAILREKAPAYAQILTAEMGELAMEALGEVELA